MNWVLACYFHTLVSDRHLTKGLKILSAYVRLYYVKDNNNDFITFFAFFAFMQLTLDW